MSAKFTDPVVEEVRTFRKAIVQVCAEKHEDYYSHLIALQENYKGRTVSPVQSRVEQNKCNCGIIPSR